MKNSRIETLRGIACLLLVSFHVVGANPQLGLQVADGPLRLINDGLAYLRMPLFTFLSGWVYGMRPCPDGDWRGFMRGKARRLLVPMLVVGSAFVALQAMVPGTNADPDPWYMTHLQPVAHFWFSEALFWVFLTVCLLERLAWLSNPRTSLAVLLAACALYLSYFGPVWLGLNCAIYLMPYFLAGMMVSRFGFMPLLARPGLRLAVGAIAALCVIMMGAPVPDPDRRTALMLAAGLSLCLAGVGAGLVHPWLARLGGDSYAIFIFHVFFTAASRTALGAIGIDSLLVAVPCGILLGLAGPCLLARLVRPHRILSFLLLGRTLAQGRRPATPAAAERMPA